MISKLQKHTPPPDHLRQLAQVTQQLTDGDRETLREYAQDRKLDGRWWRLFNETEGDDRLASLFTKELLETWWALQLLKK